MSTVFFASSSSQAEDAISISRHLKNKVILVSTGIPAFNRFQQEALINSGFEVINLAKNIPTQLHQLSLIFRGRALITKLISQQPSTVFIFGNDANPPESALIDFLHKKSMRCLLVQDGILDENELERWGIHLRGGLKNSNRIALRLLRKAGLMPPPSSYGTGNCSQLAVFGNFSRKLLTGWGVSPDKIHITGVPRFDRLFDLKPSLDHKSSGKNILWLGLQLSPYLKLDEKFDRQWLTAANTLALQNPEWRVILRPHPFESLNLYEQALNQMNPAALVIDKKTHIHAALENSDILIAHYPSTVLLEAMILRKPIIFLNLHLDCQRSIYTDKAMLEVDHTADLSKLIMNMYDDPEFIDRLHDRRRDFMIEHLGYLDGCSSRRVAELIEGA